jgi:VWFA-related protein
MKVRVVLLFGFVAMIAVAAGSAKQKPAKAGAVLRVETRLIEVNVVAQDSHGHAIKDLTRDDFKLYDNGKQVPIDVFSVLSTKPVQETKPLPPHTFSNRVITALPSVTVILLDGLNTKLSDQTWARKEVLRFLQEVQPQDQTAIFLLGDHLYMLQSFTSNPQLLLQALKNAKFRSPKEVEASGRVQEIGTAGQALGSTPGSAPSSNSLNAAQQQLGASLPTTPGGGGGGGGSGGSGAAIGAAAAAAAQAAEEQVMLQFEQHESAFFGVDRVQRTIDALIAIANYLAQFPGRKNLIWVSSSFPISIGFDTPLQPGDTRDQVHFTPELVRAFKALNNADLAVYPVDARGLTVAAPREMDMNNFYSTVGVMKDLAGHTGGRAFYNTNDLARVMHAAVEDSEANYTLGFYPHDIRWNGSYHSLKAKVTRPGVHLRYREGYYASQETPENADQTDASFHQALYSPLDSTALGLTVTLQKEVHDPGARALLKIIMDAHNFKFEAGNGGKNLELAMLVAQTGADGKVLHTARYDLKMRIEAGGLDRFLKQGLELGKWVDLVDGAKTLELVVRDPASGNVGSVRIPLGSG